MGKKKRKKNRTPHRKRKQNSEDNVASVCEQDARKTCGNESTIYYECGFKAILKRAFSSECKTKSTLSTFLVLVFKKKSLWRDKFFYLTRAMTFSRVKAHILGILIYYSIYSLNTFTKIIYLHEVYLLFKFINYLNFSKWILNPCLYFMNYFNYTISCFICFIIPRLLMISFIWSIFPLKLIKQI